MKGWVKDELINLLPPNFFLAPVPSVKGIGGKVATESKWRWAGLFTLPGGEGVFLKRDRTKGWLELLKYLVFPSKGRKEWFIAYQLGKRNLNIPKPLGWMERVRWGLVKESYYLSKAIKSGVSLAEVADILKDEKISAGLVKMVIRMHSSGLLHQDLHSGNFLWDGESFYLIDLHRARLLRSLSLNQRLWNLSHLFHSLRSIWGKEEHLRFLDQYFEGDSISSQKKKEYLMKIHSWMVRLQKRQWKSRTKRCLKESTEFSVQREGGATIYKQRGFSTDTIKGIIQKHLLIVNQEIIRLKKTFHKPSPPLAGVDISQFSSPLGGGDIPQLSPPLVGGDITQLSPPLVGGDQGEGENILIKKDKEVNVSMIIDGEKKICVKQFLYPHQWDRFKERFRISKGLKAWINGNGLKVRGVSSPLLLAYIEKRDWFGMVESFLVMEAQEGAQEMDRYICKGFSRFEEKRVFIEGFARWLSQLHQKGIYHQDMKTCNILVSENGQVLDFKLLDLEDVRLNEKVDDKKLFKNLLQINTSMPNLVTRTDRLRFFRAYQEPHPIIRNQKKFLFRLIQKSRERGIVYVSPHGVVEENLN